MNLSMMKQMKTIAKIRTEKNNLSKQRLKHLTLKKIKLIAIILK